MTTLSISKTVYQQMLDALRAVRDWDMEQYNATGGMPARLCDIVENAHLMGLRELQAQAQPAQAGVARPEPYPFMTLSEFRASGREVNHRELEEIAGTDLGHDQGGRAYAHGYLYVEHYADEWCLTIMNDSWTGELKTLEAILYGYARIEILPRLTGADEQQALIDEWATFCKDEGLECVDAEEMLHAAIKGKLILTSAQRGYLEDFIHRWEQWETEQQ